MYFKKVIISNKLLVPTNKKLKYIIHKYTFKCIDIYMFLIAFFVTTFSNNKQLC